MKKYSTKINLVCFFTLIISLFIDQITKFIAQKSLEDNGPFIIIKDVFNFTLHHNEGVGFGLLENKYGFILIINFLLLIIITILYFRLPKLKRFLPLHLIIIFIMSGALGNIIDRIRLSYVIDFIDFTLIDFPIFNVADMYITVSVFVLILLLLFFYKEEELNNIFDKSKSDDLTGDTDNE